MAGNQATQIDAPGSEEFVKSADFFSAAYLAFQDAEQKAGLPDYFYQIGGYVVKLRFGSNALVPRITPALQHLATSATPTPDLTVCVWDSVNSGVALPPSSWSVNPQIEHGEVRGYVAEHIYISHQLGANTLSMLDTELNRAIFWIGDGNELPYWESGSPVRSILHWWLSSKGLQLVHAAAVGAATGGVLLTGKGGSGKSTTALTCLKSELNYASDDYCLVTTNPHPYVYSLYNSAKVNADNIHRVPHLEAAVSNRDRLAEEKALFFLHQYCPEKIVAGFPLKAILLPRITGQPDTTLSLASAATGLRALAPTTLFQLPGVSHQAFQTMSSLVKKLPVYYLNLGTDTAKIPGVIAELLQNGYGNQE